MWDVRTTHGMQYFLARAIWDTDGVRDDLRDYVVGASGDSDAICPRRGPPTRTGSPKPVFPGSGFATEPALATGMLTGALQAGVPARWVTDYLSRYPGLPLEAAGIMPVARTLSIG